MPSGLFREFDAFIGYSPMGDEPDFGAFLKMCDIVSHTSQGMSVLADRDTDPKAFAESVTQKYLGKKVCVFVPGREFDTTGTRHGRGGGWYDRFLSAVPREWLRIGVLNASQLSSMPLIRQPWDEPMDVLLIKEESSWKTLPVNAGL